MVSPVQRLSAAFVRSARILLFFVVIAPCLVPTGARAHAIVLESSPALGSTVSGPDVTISLRFNSRIDIGRSQLILTDPAGRVTQMPMQAGLEPQFGVGHLNGLKPGKYKLRWQVLSVDGHITRGDIPFSVAAN